MCSLILFSIASAQSDTKEQNIPPVFGLKVKYQAGDISFESIETRVAFHSGTGESAIRLPSGTPVKITWTGMLQAPDDGKFTLHFFAHGKLTVRVDNRVVVDRAAADTPTWFEMPVELTFGPNEFKVEYSSTGEEGELGAYWSGPNFPLEPIAPRFFKHVPLADSAAASSGLTNESAFELGAKLYRALRCSACHVLKSQQDETPLRAPALTHLQDNLRPSWLVAHLQSKAPAGSTADDLAERRMPYFELDRNSATAISAALFEASQASAQEDFIAQELKQLRSRRKRKDPPIRMTADPELGAEVFASKGCLACHRAEELSKPQDWNQVLFGGGSLDLTAQKRTPQFLARWLKDPSAVNAQHRMPSFELTTHERLDLQSHLRTLGGEDSRNDTRAAGDVDRGMGLIAEHRCAACHDLPKSLESQNAEEKTELSENSDWTAGCLTAADDKRFLPGYGLSKEHRDALQTFVSGRKQTTQFGEQYLAENNCLACHSRDEGKGIAAHLADVAETYPNTAARLAALSPPSLTGVGDKLTDEALLEAIEGRQAKLRPWLEVQMPKFALEGDQAKRIREYFIEADRIPDRKPTPGTHPFDKGAELAGARLVGSQGFGCTSCHSIGPYESPQVDLKARGPNLAMPGKRIRESWYYRWVENPSRIVPRMEMPAIQTPVAGVLGGDLDRQLSALWSTLNQPDFKPPRPNPVRVVRSHNISDYAEDAKVVMSVIESPEKTYLRPMAIGLPNRQNLLFDIEAGSFAGWWLGDTANQYTRGKTWYWEFGSEFLNLKKGSVKAPLLQELRMVDKQGWQWRPAVRGQVAFSLDSIEHIEDGLKWQGELSLRSNRGSNVNPELTQLPVQFVLRADGATTQLKTSVKLSEEVKSLQLHSDAKLEGNAFSGRNWTVRIDDISGADLQTESGIATLVVKEREVSWTTLVETPLAADSIPVLNFAKPNIRARTLDCVPGYEAVRLPLTRREMPISFAWGPKGELYAGSLKGKVLRLFDDDGDGLEDRYEQISDTLPTPYGLQVNDDGSVDALSKFALIRLSQSRDRKSENLPTWNSRIIADGWGYTADYHDWAVGLERDALGCYYVVLPCQQDERTEAAAKWRGHALMLLPSDRLPRTTNIPGPSREFTIVSLAAGLRFPMGLARRQDGQLFATDNQGNYNPFNELNHIQRGKRYGFINKLENKNGFSPRFESPAIELPHPWTRSVNGICWLETPESSAEPNRFGAFEGHLLGCEMNGRSLIRMSLQKVAGQYQGAAYNFSLPGLDPSKTFEGPIVCEIAPDGDIYVGNLQDSGWGGGQNTGSIVRLRPTDELPLGIAEVRANATGFDIDFTQPVERQKAEKAKFLIRSYRRISTPAYGGNDQDEKLEKVAKTQISKNRRSLSLRLSDELREGYVYEINIPAIGKSETKLFPAQAHYTMRAVPIK